MICTSNKISQIHNNIQQCISSGYEIPKIEE